MNDWQEWEKNSEVVKEVNGWGGKMNECKRMKWKLAADEWQIAMEQNTLCNSRGDKTGPLHDIYDCGIWGQGMRVH